jgi:predicted Zn finger-like uncharacterized protein
MALATQCPHCQTTFRVAHDQLKLRAGLVRCGVCKQIFNGIENLLRPEEADKAFPPSDQVPAPEAPIPTPAPIAVPAPSPPEQPEEERASPSPDFDFDMGTSGGHTETEEAPETAASIDDGSQASSDAVQEEAPQDTEEPPASADPLLRMTLLDIAPKRANQGESAEDTEAAPVEDGLEKTIDDLQAKPWRSEEAETSDDQLDRVDEREYEEPGFVKQARRRQRIGKVMRIVMAALLPVLLLGGLAQAAYVFRVQIAAWFPQARPVLMQMCDVLHCEVGFPTRIDVVSIESNELQAPAVEDGPFTLNVLLRNRGTVVQSWPNIELTLNDANDKPVARRIFTPREYLPAGADASKGFAARSEQQVKLFLSLQDLKASGYRVYVFYP